MRSEIPVVCHDRRNLINGMIRNITETGCELVSSVNSPNPAFPHKTAVLLNVLDEMTGRSVNVQARLTNVMRQDGAWTYKIRWNEFPQILK